MQTDLAYLTDIVNQKLLSLQERLNKPLEADEYYSVGLMVMLGGGILGWLFNSPIFSLAEFWLGALILVICFCCEIFRKFLALLKVATVGTILLGIPSSAFIASIAVVVAEQLVNEATLTDPSYFQNSTNIIAALAVPYVLAYFFAAWLVLCFIYWLIKSSLQGYIGTILLPFRKKVNTQPNDKIFVEMGRTIAAILLSMSIIFGLGNITMGPSSGLQTSIKFLVARVDHYPYVHCAGVSSGERYRLIDKDLLSVVSIKPHISFSQRNCSPE